MQKLEILGADYISQFIAMKTKQRNDELTYQIYIAESIRLHAQNKALTIKLADLLIPQSETKEMTAKEAKDVILAEYEKINKETGETSGSTN